jgi:hypothetical protein
MVHELISYTPEVIYSSLMGAMAIGSGVLSLGKSIFGGIQAARGGRDYKRLSEQAPQYDVEPPEYFQDLLSMYNKQGATRAPGSEMEEERADVELAEAARRMEEVDDTRGILGGLQEAYTKTQARKRAIGQTDAEYAAADKARMEAGREGVMKFGVGLETDLAREKFGYEVSEWDIKMNEASERRKAGWQNVFGGLTEGASAGTSYAFNKSLLESLQGFRGAPSKINPILNPSIPDKYQPSTELKDMRMY